MLLKCCSEYVSKFGKYSSGHRTRKFTFHSNPKEGQSQRVFKLPYICTHFTCQQDYAEHPSSQASLVRELRTSRFTCWIQKRQRNQRSNANICWIIENAREFQKYIHTSASLITLKPLTVWITTNCRKFFKRWKYQTTLPAF